MLRKIPLRIYLCGAGVVALAFLLRDETGAWSGSDLPIIGVLVVSLVGDLIRAISKK